MAKVNALTKEQAKSLLSKEYIPVVVSFMDYNYTSRYLT